MSLREFTQGEQTNKFKESIGAAAGVEAAAVTIERVQAVEGGLALAAFMRLRAMLPDASTAKMTSAPALRTIFLVRTSPARAHAASHLG